MNFNMTIQEFKIIFIGNIFTECYWQVYWFIFFNIYLIFFFIKKIKKEYLIPFAI